MSISIRRALGAATMALLLAAGPAAANEWKVPDVESLPKDKYGQMVRYGKELVTATYKYVGPEVADPKMRYAGNNFACQTCHLEAGTKKFGAPFVGAFADYPQYRPREDQVQNIEERVNGCMERSMSGKELPVDGKEMRAIVSYLHFMSKDVPVGSKLEGRAVPRIKIPARAADPVAGEVVYAENCAVCHGEDGLGKRNGVKGDALGYEFPPVWGPDSYNTGAGMARVIMAANFIKHNMPVGTTYDAPALTDDQAFDVSAYINSKPRPEKANLDTDFPARKNKPVDAAFAPYVYGTPEQHKYGPFQPLIQARNKALEAK